MSNEEKNDLVEKFEELQSCFSDVKHYLSKTGDLLDELDDAFDPDDARVYMNKLAGFMENLTSDMEGFIRSIVENKNATLSLSFPVGLDPKSLFFPDEE